MSERFFLKNYFFYYHLIQAKLCKKRGTHLNSYFEDFEVLMTKTELQVYFFFLRVQVWRGMVTVIIIV